MIRKILNIVCLALIVASCSHTIKLSAQNSDQGLKDYYKKYFNVGVAVNINSLHGEDSALIVREFSSITPENDLKIGPVHPAEQQYNWKNGDATIAFAQHNNLKVRGHNLVWHYTSQLQSGSSWIKMAGRLQRSWCLSV